MSKSDIFGAKGGTGRERASLWSWGEHGLSRLSSIISDSAKIIEDHRRNNWGIIEYSEVTSKEAVWVIRYVHAERGERERGVSKKGKKQAGLHLIPSLELFTCDKHQHHHHHHLLLYLLLLLYHHHYHRPLPNMSIFSFSTPLDIDIVLDSTDDRPTVDVKLDKSRREKCPLYLDGETVKGAVTIRPKDGKRLEHTGIKVQFVGTIEMFFDRGTHHEFLSLQTELAAPGELQHPVTLPFSFKNVEKPYESYHGINVKLRYFLRVTVSRRMADVVREKDLWVYSYRQPPETNSVIKMDVGIEDCLHIEFEYSKSKYHLKDVIVGRIYFLLVRLKIRHMELSIIRRETTGVPPNQYNESETLVRFEIMDGSPSRGETIPIRLFLGGFDLTPTFRDVNKKYSTRYYLSLVLIDEDARRYFKQSEIVLYRQAPENSELAQRQAKEIQAS